MKKIIKRIFGIPLQLWAKVYFRKPRKYSFNGIKGLVLPGVFFPHLTFSTKFLLRYLEKQDLVEKTFLELGCGTGIISVLAAKKAAAVTSSDVNPIAIENVKLNAIKNKVYIHAVQSNLFKKITLSHFDWIVINPPYYPKNPVNDAEKAWFCGEHFEYFKALFSALGHYFKAESQVIMILSEDCDIDRIQKIAQENHLGFTLVEEQIRWWERNYIFRIQKISKSG